MAEESGKKIYTLGGRQYYVPSDGLQLDQYTQLQDIVNILLEGFTKKKMSIIDLVMSILKEKKLYKALSILLVPVDEIEWDEKMREETEKVVGKMKDYDIVEVITNFIIGRATLMTSVTTVFDDSKKKNASALPKQADLELPVEN